MSRPDFAVCARIAVGGAGELAELLRAGGDPVRLAGSATAQDRIPPPRAPVRLVSLAPMARITRLDAADLTCTVEPGLPRAALDAELARHDLELACPGDGTLGGIFARGAPPLAPGAPAPRALLLGLEGVLGDGTRFKAGGRVVKNVAGYDLTKLFVGSRGRLCAATALHLKLRVRPRAVGWFASDGLDVEAARAKFLALRCSNEPPAALAMAVAGGQASLHGRFEGRAGDVRRRLASAGKEAAPRAFTSTPTAGEELVHGNVRPSRLGSLLALLPASARLLVTGAGAFEAAIPPGASDSLLAALPTIDAAGELAVAPPERRGRATPSDPGAARIAFALRARFDPHEILQ